jgi:hypothetical protein
VQLVRQLMVVPYLIEDARRVLLGRPLAPILISVIVPAPSASGRSMCHASPMTALEEDTPGRPHRGVIRSG